MKKYFSLALALLLALTVLPLSAVPTKAKTAEPCWTVPAGYNENDYNRCAAFLEQRDQFAPAPDAQKVDAGNHFSENDSFVFSDSASFDAGGSCKYHSDIVLIKHLPSGR